MSKDKEIDEEKWGMAEYRGQKIIEAEDFDPDKHRLVYCLCCKKHHPLKVPPMIDVDQECVYCDKCNDECSYVYSNGKTIYYHQIRRLSIVHMNKNWTIEFAKKYLEDRKEQWMDDTFPRDQIWNVAAEYILDDIIPFLYGEALD